MNFLGIGLFELLVIGGLGYLLFGPRKMGEAGRTLGKALRELRRQRDEFTSLLVDDPVGEERTGRKSEGRGVLPPVSDDDDGLRPGSDGGDSISRSGDG